MKRLAWIAGIAGLVIIALGASSGTVRSVVSGHAWRLIAPIRPPDIALIGDSRLRDCQRLGRLTPNPFDTVNLAVGGIGIKAITTQIDDANALGARQVVIAAGLNDLLLGDASIDRIEADFAALLQRLAPNQRGVVTLIAYTSDRAWSLRIDRANATIRMLAEGRGLHVLDLNSDVAADGILLPDMTHDGIHFTTKACTRWFDRLRPVLGASTSIKTVTGR